MCKRFRVTLGLVTALAVALLCNVYLVFLLWSGGKNDEYQDASTSPQPVVIKPEASINFMNSGLNIQYINAMLNVTKRLSRSRSKSLQATLNRLKRELKSRGGLYPTELINISSSKVC